MDRNEDALLKFGRRLAELRQLKDVTVIELSRYSGIDPRQIRRIEAGEVNLLFTTILALAKGLKVSPEELLDTL